MLVVSGVFGLFFTIFHKCLDIPRHLDGVGGQHHVPAELFYVFVCFYHCIARK